MRVVFLALAFLAELAAWSALVGRGCSVSESRPAGHAIGRRLPIHGAA